MGSISDEFHDAYKHENRSFIEVVKIREPNFQAGVAVKESEEKFVLNSPLHEGQPNIIGTQKMHLTSVVQDDLNIINKERD